MNTAACNRVLVAEDDEVSARMLSHFLNTWGFDVITAEDGVTAAAVLDSEEAPALALIDWMMPGMEGVDVCRHVRAQVGRPYTYLVLLTAKADKKAVAAGLEAGADDFVAKPCDLNELRARLRVGQRVVSLERALAQQVVALQDTLDQVRQLKEMLPICAWCKRVRDDADYWHTIEEYLHVHTGTDFTHGICPDCVRSMRAGLTTHLSH